MKQEFVGTCLYKLALYFCITKKKIMKGIHFIGMLILSVLIISCSNDNDNDNDNILDVPQNIQIKSDNNSLTDYLTVKDGQWILQLSEEEATLMGKSAEYTKLIEQMQQINNRIKELQDNPNAIIDFNLPTNERITMRSGEVLSRTVESPITKAGPLPIKSMLLNQSTYFYTKSYEYRINSQAVVQSVFLWSFELRDNIWAVYWNASGVGPTNIGKMWTYPLTVTGIDNYWSFSSSGTGTDGTDIRFDFYK